ncbi:T9SS type A sorting domain-containing protein [bacterium]|nr:T9SS type A sorting domain-containing protein [bacterium]
MKYSFVLSMLLLSFQGMAQIGLGYYDLPNRGEIYLRKSVINMSYRKMPGSINQQSTEAIEWDFSGITDATQPDTSYYYWVEGTPAAFDFPDANMVDHNPDNSSAQYVYFIKNPTGFYLSGQSGSMNTPMGQLDIKAEFRPAAPLLKVPAKLGDEVDEVSRASVDLLSLGKVLITSNVHYVIDGFGTVIIPGGASYEVLRIKRETATEAIVSVSVGPQEIHDTTTTIETAYEFYTNGYGDAIAKFTISEEQRTGTTTYSFAYKDDRIVSSVQPAPLSKTANNLNLIYISSLKQLIIKNTDLQDGGRIEVYNTNGQLVRELNATSQVLTVDMAALPAGVYVVKSTSNNKIIETGKFIIAQ